MLTFREYLTPSVPLSVSVTAVEHNFFWSDCEISLALRTFYVDVETLTFSFVAP